MVTCTLGLCMMELNQGKESKYEDDVVFDSRKYYLFIRKAVYDGKWRLVDYDPEYEEEYLRTNNFGIIAWRYDVEMIDEK